MAVGEAVLRAGRRLEDDELRHLALLAIVDADPSRLDAWQGLALFEESHGGDPEAIYRRLLDERPEDAAAHVAWARHLASGDRPEEALGSLGLAHRAARQNRSAVEAFDRALALEPEFPEAARAREERAQALALAGGARTFSPPRP